MGEVVNVGDVVFTRSSKMNEEELSEMWDDTSLIEAYDKAVSLAYDAVHANLNAKGETAAAEALNTFKEPKPVHKNDVTEPKASKKPKKKRKRWQVGEKCLAKYGNDGILYQARILDVSRQHNKCTIVFDGYETELEYNLGALKQVLSDSANSEATDGNGSGNESASEMSSSNDDLANQNPKTSKNLPHKIQNLPFAPPPMPPAFLPPQNRSKIDENEAMASMLMSWYMSGYHTGYYQALQDAKKPRK